MPSSRSAPAPSDCRSPRRIRILKPLIELGQARGEIRTDIPAETLAHFVLRSILGALSDWGLGTDPLDRDRALELAVTLVLDALARRDDG